MRKSARKSRRNQAPTHQQPGELVDVRRTAYQFVIEQGLERLREQLEEDISAVCGVRYRHDVERVASRHGSTTAPVTLGGRSVRVERPRARTADGEVELPTWVWATEQDPLDERAAEQMLVGVSTRKYPRSLERLPDELEESGVSKSSVSRRFIAATERKLEDLLSADLRELDLAALMIDGVHFVEHVVLVAIGVDVSGRKHVLSLHEGATENATACRALLADLVERGVPTDRSLLIVMDGAKGLRAAVRDVFGERAHVQRCQVHKKRNVLEHLPEAKRRPISVAMNEAYRCGNPKRAKRLLQNIARRLEDEHPGAASSLKEGLTETLTVMRFSLTEALERTLSTTNMIENAIGTTRHVARRVKRWRGGTMMLRWLAGGLLEAARGFRRLRGYKSMKTLVEALRARDRELDMNLDTIKSVG